MDSEDERKMQRESEQRAKGYYFPSRPSIEMRLYERREAELKISVEIARVDAKKNEEGTGQNQNDEPQEPQVEDNCFYRLHRLFGTFEGFHEGSLDLTGRHEQRYMSLKSRMTSFLEDIEHLRLYSTRVEYVPSIPIGGQSTLFDYEIPSRMLDQFMDKYKLTDNSFGLRYLFESADDVKKLLSSHPQPIFQKLLLADLPIELIHHIMELGGIDVARRLAATCHRFYEMSSAHAFKSRHIVFAPMLNWMGDNLPAPDSGSWEQYLHSAAHRARRKLIDDISFLNSRPDIIHHIRDLNIGSGWPLSLLAGAGLEAESDAHMEFFAPIWHAVEDILPSIMNVTRIVMFTVPLSRGMIHAIETISTLRTLEFIDCRFSAHKLVLPALSSLVNIRFHLLEAGFDPILKFLRLLPNIRTLYVHGEEERGSIWLPTSFRATCNPFLVVERVLIVNFKVRRNVRALSSWIREAAEVSEGRLPLTHFKLHTIHGIRRERILDLVSAVRGAPLRRLVLDGLNYVGEELFRSIADAFPNLRSLALSHRQSALQSHSRACVWPEPTWIYAKYLTNFRHLRQFAWNFSIEPIYVGTTYDLPYMEEGYPERWIGDYRLEYFSDWSCLAKLFAAHCPTLESLMFTSNCFATLDFSISQDKAGRILVVTGKYCSLNERIAEINPNPLMGDRNPWEIDEGTLR